MTRKDDKGDQPSGGETTWTNTGATRYGRGQHKTGSFGDGMLRPSPNHGTLRLPNDDDDDMQMYFITTQHCTKITRSNTNIYMSCKLLLCYGTFLILFVYHVTTCSTI